jgi:putative membrane-bound dehydrogenase-like protein
MNRFLSIVQVLLGVAAILFCSGHGLAVEKEQLFSVGVAKMDITPAYPIRLCGYAVRKTESEGVAQHLWAKALAIGTDKDGPAILITVDNTGVPASIRNQLATRLQSRAGTDPARLALCSSHSHSAPCLAGNLPTLFGAPLPPEHQEHVERYTRELVDALEKVALEALKARRPAKLSWSQGLAAFAANRRTKGGPVDHALPILVVTSPREEVRAILTGYACHCTTLGGDWNQICGDWAGYAQEYLERDHPGAIVLTAIGCGADANPEPRNNLALAQQHGREIAVAVNQILSHTLAPLTAPLMCRFKQIELPFDKLPAPEEWEQRARQTNNPYVAYYGKVNLAKLQRGEQIRSKLPYLVQTWNFGDQLGMVFLAGEVVVDYSIRLKREFDSTRLWVNAYANDVPCYIPSERILREGGYEAEGAMTYYDKPSRLASGVENKIVQTVHELMPASFLFNEQEAEYPPARSPDESLALMQTKAGFNIELAAAEPLIVDPVAIDWGPDGKLWVVEMRDYPTGMDGHWKPGSRVKFLEDTNGDGKYDKATVFLDGLPFATGITAWRKGVLVCTAPDILYAEDTNDDGKADVVKKIFTGFANENFQARVNSLSLGLDNWIYGANGLLGGVIRGSGVGLSPVRKAGTPPPLQNEIDIRGRDFRMDPDTGAFEPASGLTQQGRVRDDWDNWFGCDNSTIAWHYPMPDHYLRRNPFVTAPNPRLSIATGDDPNLLHPASRTLERFNDPHSANRVTSGCGLGTYRDDWLGAGFYGNAFLCEPVHNLVHRLVLHPQELTFTGTRADDEQQSEFLASRDNWFRPVQARTGPDGALYVVDMYRFVIEHPRWIPPERLAKLNVRAGEDQGRIYRVVPKGKKLRPVPNLTKLSTAKLVAALDNPNGTERDRVHLELLWRPDKAAARPLQKLFAKSRSPAIRLQALCVLDGLHALPVATLQEAFADSNAAVRRHAVRLSEAFPNESLVRAAVLQHVEDPELEVRFQVALTLGEWKDARAAEALGKLAARDMGDTWMRAAVLSSAVQNPAQILQAVLSTKPEATGRSEMIEQLIATAVGIGDSTSLASVMAVITPADATHHQAWQLTALTSLLDALERKKTEVAVPGALNVLFNWARELANDESASVSDREAGIRLLGHSPEPKPDLQLLIHLLDATTPPRLHTAALDALKHNRDRDIASLLLANWNLRSPALRQSIIALLLTRNEWTQTLLATVESGSVGRGEITPADRQRLLKSTSSDLKERAESIWKDSQSNSRAEVLAKYQSAANLTGDISHGAAIFGNSCASCHFLRGQGRDVGPNLAPLADKPVGDFLTAILDPNAAVEPRFIAYNIDTKDDRSLTGIVNAETATTLTLVQGGGFQENILRSDIQSIRASGLSLMPEGLEQNLNPQDMADLIAYLKTSPRPFGSATAEQAEQAKTKFLASGMNGLARLVSTVEQLPYPSWMGSLPLACCRQTDANSKLLWETAPVPAELKPESPHLFRLAAGMGFASQPSGKFELRLNNKVLLQFDVALTDQSWQSTDGKVRMNYTVLENNSEDSNGILEIEIPGSFLQPGQPSSFKVTGSAANSQRWFGIYLVPVTSSHAAR